MFNYTKTTDAGTETNVPKVIGHLILAVIIGTGLLVGLFGSWTTIDASEQGVVLRLGDVNRVIGPGFHWKTPFIEDVVKIDVRTIKQEVFV